MQIAQTASVCEEPPRADARPDELPHAPHIRLLPDTLTDPEPRWKRHLFLALAVAITAGYLLLLLSYFAAASPGVDQNGYLVGGKRLALTGSSGFKPTNPFEYVGFMWVMAGDPEKGDVWYYPKYPLGLPLLNAIPLWIDWEQGKVWAMYVSPVCTALSLLAIFLLVRQIASSFVALLAALLLGINGNTLTLANMPWSHGPALMFVGWGMYVLLRWWQTGAIWRGLLAGFLLGYAVTVRYTEGLLLLPLLAAVLCTLRYRQITSLPWWRAAAAIAIAAGATWLRLHLHGKGVPWIATAAGLLTVAVLAPWWRIRSSLRSWEPLRGLLVAGLVVTVVLMRVPGELILPRDDAGKLLYFESYELQALIILSLTFAGLILFVYAPAVWRRAMVPLVGWAVPVLWLVGFNWFAMGSITGYDSTNESTAFTSAEFGRKWEFMVQQLYDYGAFFILPFTVMGLAVMWRWNWRIALMSLLWLVPGLLLYASYYWGMDLVGMAYLRFFLTLLPAMIIPALWYLRHGSWWNIVGNAETRGSIAMPIACGLIVGIATTLSLRNTLPTLERDLAVNSNLQFTCDAIVQNVPAGSVVFTDQRMAMYGLLNFLQWKGDYELYAADAFNTGGGVMTRGPADPDRPAPRQFARRNFMRDHVYRGKSDADLIREQHSIVHNALQADQPRRVFAILPTNWVPVFQGRFIARSNFEWKLQRQWNEPLTPVMERNPPPLMPRPRNFGQGRGPTTWQLFEITLKPSSPPGPAAPATTAPIASR